MKKLKLLIVERDDLTYPRKEDRDAADVILLEAQDAPGYYKIVKSSDDNKLPRNGYLVLG